MKKRILLVLLLFVFTGCSNENEVEKNEYIAMKSNLLEEDITTSADELPLDILVKIDRETEEEVKYKVSFSNSKENMHDIEAMVIHNYYNEDVFPTIGLFDKKGELLVDNDEVIELSDTIETNKNLSAINLELKVYIQYKDDFGEKKEIYYKAT